MKYARNIAIGLLVFLGITAVLGSMPMMVFPGGSSTTMPLAALSHSPFHSYLIPGVLLLTANGLLAFAILWMVSRRRAYSSLWTVFQGCVLLVWLAVECWMLRAVIWLHYVYAGIGVMLIAAGMVMNRQGRAEPGSQRIGDQEDDQGENHQV